MTTESKIKFDKRAVSSLDAYVKNVIAIWSDRDRKRGTEDVWLHVVNHASKLGEAARKFDHKEIREHLAHFIMWFFTFIGKLETNANDYCNPQDRLMTISGITLDDIVWEKYPGFCPWCFRQLPRSLKKPMKPRKPCFCILDPLGIENRAAGLTREEKEKHERKQRAKLVKYADKNCIDDKPKNITEWDEMFEEIFGNKLIILDFNSIMFHLLEEVGEVSDAIIRSYTYNIQRKEKATAEEVRNRSDALKNEIADVMSWTFALIVKYRELCRMWSEAGKTKKVGPVEAPLYLAWKALTIPNLIWEVYQHNGGDYLGCPTCGKENCICRLRLLTKTAKVKSVLKRIAKIG